MMATNLNTINDVDSDNGYKDITMPSAVSSDKQDEEMRVIPCLKSVQSLSNSCCIAEKVNHRVQIDVVDMQEYKTKKYRYFFIYEDQFSKYIILKALETNSVDEIAEKLIDIFMIIGVPQIVQSNNGIDYAKNLVQHIKLHVPGVNIVHGNVIKNNHTIRDFKNLIESWQMKNPTREWHQGLKYIQILENIALNVHSIKSPAAFILNENILVDVERVIKNSGIVCNLPSKPNLLMKQAKPLGTYWLENNDMGFGSTSVNKNINEYQLVVEIKNRSPLTAFKSNKNSDEKVEEEQSSIKIIEGYEISPNYHSNERIRTFQCNNCSESYHLVELYEKHIYQCHNEKMCSIASHGKDNEASEQSNMNKKFEKSQLITLQSNITKEIMNYDTSMIQNSSSSNSRKFIKRPTFGLQRKGINDSTKTKNNALLVCEYCEHRFNFPSVLKRHMRTHTNERPYVCQICRKSFKQLGHLSQHLLTHTDYRSFQCTICGIKCQSLDALKAHSGTHKEISKSNNKSLTNDTYRLYECDNCKKVFATKSVLERHILTHTHERHFGCKICGKRFKQAGHVKSHMVIHSGERKFSCSICLKRFSLSNALKKHMYVHNGEKPYQCDICGSRFLEKRNLNGHIMTHTNEKPFACKICDKRYTLADTLKRHVSAAHEDGRTYQCEICAKMFKQLAHLSVHKKVHTDERPFQCHLCDKNFKHKNVLKSHLAIHANIRPFQCDICKATFIRKTNLQTHIISAHMNERPYICTICNKRFKQISHLNGHIVVHSNSMPYQCEFCERRCNRLDNLKKHMRLHTKAEDK